MKILYISDHSILEYDELTLFTELGHDCFSLGAYHNLGHSDLPRPSVAGLIYHEDLDVIYRANPNRTQLDQRLIDWADVIIVMHSPHVLAQNWPRLRHKKVIWRTIGQSVPHIEKSMAELRAEGLKIVRYSPKERQLDDYCGEDALIRFYKDEDVYNGWTGDDKRVVNFTQTLKGRRQFCHHDEIMAVIEHFDGTIYGPGNEDLGKYNGGEIPFEDMLKAMRRAGVMIYGGTWPAPYTLSFIEALMTGLPIVAISKKLAHIQDFQDIDFYEVDELLGEISGPVCDTPEQMIEQTQKLLTIPEHAKNVSLRQRELAMRHFSKKVIGRQWAEFLAGL